MTIEAAYFQTLAESRSYRQIAAELVRLEKLRATLDLEAMTHNPEAALHGNDEVTVEYDLNPRAGCSVFGYYLAVPKGQSLIFVHPSLSQERDNFTILHELGHHVQRQHDTWADVRYGFEGRNGDLLEERVADAFAAEILIPAEAISASANWLNAQALSDIFGQVRASRAAVAMRAVEIAPESEAASVAVTDSHGKVTFSRTSSDQLFAPARGLIQPGIARLIERAEAGAGHASGILSEGLQSRSGWTQSDLIADVALDHTGAYAFAVIRQNPGYGLAPAWGRSDDVECSREACGHVFAIIDDTEHCDVCNAPKCPNCRSCACESKLMAVCERCTMALSNAEQLDPSIHECW